MSRPPEIGVLMAVHESTSVSHLADAVESIFNQTFEGWLLFLYVDGPIRVDLETYIKNLPVGKTIIIRGQECRGLSYGLNALIEYISTNNNKISFLARMDSDDVCCPHRFARQRDFLLGNCEVDVVGSWCVEFDHGTKKEFEKRVPISHDDICRFACYRSPMIHPTVMFRADILLGGIRYSTSYLKAQDYELWSRLIRAGHRFANIPEVLLRYRVSNSLYARRAGFKLVMRETLLRITYARTMNFGSLAVYLQILGFFLVRMAPGPLKKFAYQQLR